MTEMHPTNPDTLLPPSPLSEDEKRLLRYEAAHTDTQEAEALGLPAHTPKDKVIRVAEALRNKLKKG